MFARHGLPEKSDNGPRQNSKNTLSGRASDTTELQRSGPQENGEVERQNSSLLKRLQIAHVEKMNWKRELITYLAAY